jgi:hypothetical protein
VGDIIVCTTRIIDKTTTATASTIIMAPSATTMHAMSRSMANIDFQAGPGSRGGGPRGGGRSTKSKTSSTRGPQDLFSQSYSGGFFDLEPSDLFPRSSNNNNDRDKDNSSVASPTSVVASSSSSSSKEQQRQHIRRPTRRASSHDKGSSHGINTDLSGLMARNHRGGSGAGRGEKKLAGSSQSCHGFVGGDGTNDDLFSVVSEATKSHYSADAAFNLSKFPQKTTSSSRQQKQKRAEKNRMDQFSKSFSSFDFDPNENLQFFSTPKKACSKDDSDIILDSNNKLNPAGIRQARKQSSMIVPSSKLEEFVNFNKQKGSTIKRDAASGMIMDESLQDHSFFAGSQSIALTPAKDKERKGLDRFAESFSEFGGHTRLPPLHGKASSSKKSSSNRTASVDVPVSSEKKPIPRRGAPKRTKSAEDFAGTISGRPGHQSSSRRRRRSSVSVLPSMSDLPPPVAATQIEKQKVSVEEFLMNLDNSAANSSSNGDHDISSNVGSEKPTNTSATSSRRTTPKRSSSGRKKLSSNSSVSTGSKSGNDGKHRRSSSSKSRARSKSRTRSRSQSPTRKHRSKSRSRSKSPSKETEATTTRSKSRSRTRSQSPSSNSRARSKSPSKATEDTTTRSKSRSRTRSQSPSSKKNNSRTSQSRSSQNKSPPAPTAETSSSTTTSSTTTRKSRSYSRDPPSHRRSLSTTSTFRDRNSGEASMASTAPTRRLPKRSMSGSGERVGPPPTTTGRRGMLPRRTKSGDGSSSHIGGGGKQRRVPSSDLKWSNSISILSYDHQTKAATKEGLGASVASDNKTSSTTTTSSSNSRCRQLPKRCNTHDGANLRKRVSREATEHRDRKDREEQQQQSSSSSKSRPPSSSQRPTSSKGASRRASESAAASTMARSNASSSSNNKSMSSLLYASQTINRRAMAHHILKEDTSPNAAEAVLATAHNYGMVRATTTQRKSRPSRESSSGSKQQRPRRNRRSSVA